MIVAGSGRWIDGRCSGRRIDGRESTPNRWPSGAVQAVPVLFEAAAKTGDDALHNSAPVGDRCGPGRLSLQAGDEPLELVVAKADGGVKTGGFGDDVVLPAPAGIGLTFSPGGGLFGLGAPRPPAGSVLSFPPGGS
jgi:hypothetical protein